MKLQSLKRYVVVTTLSSLLVTMPVLVHASSVLDSKKGLLELRTITGQQYSDFTDGTTDEAGLFYPTSLLEQQDGSIVISDTKNHKLRLLVHGQLQTLSGHIVDFDQSGEPVGSYGDGAIDVAMYQSPGGLAMDAEGQIYVADTNNHSIRVISKDGTVKTLAGSWRPGNSDGIGEEASFYYPSDVALDSKGNVYVADTLNHLIRKIDKDGKVTTLNKASERVVQYVPGVLAYSGNFADGPLAQSQFNEPSGLAIDAQDNLYVSDKGNQRIRYIDFATNTVSTVAGGGSYDNNQLYVEGDYVDGPVAVSRLSSPAGITVTKSGTVLFADTLNHSIRAIKDGEITTVAGVGGEYGYVDGVLDTAQLNQPTDVIELANGNLAIADSYNNKIKVLQPYQKPAGITEDGKIHIILHDKLIESDVAPIIEQNRTYVPLRVIAAELGMNVNYIAKNKQYELIVHENLTFTFNAVNNKVQKLENGVATTLTMDSSIIVADQRVLIPVRFIAEQLGYDVQWDQANNNVIIRHKSF